MKTRINDLFLGTDNKLGGIIALALILAIALGCTCGKELDLANLGKDTNTSSTNSSTSSSDEAMPSKALLDALVAETTADFNYAITLNDFSGMYEKASSDFKSTYTEEQFANTFKEFVDKRRVITPILAKTVAMEPEYSPEPYIRTEKGVDILVVNGKYSTKPVPMNFEYEYVKRNDQWKLLKLIIKLA